MLDQDQTIVYAFYSLNQSQSHSSPTTMLSSTPQCQLQFDSGGTTFLHLLVPAFFVSIIVTSTSGYHPIFPRLFRSSLLVSIDTTSTLSLSLQLPQLRRHSFPSLPLSLLRSSFFVSLGNAFSLLVRTFTSFLLSHLLSHSILASEVPT